MVGDAVPLRAPDGAGTEVRLGYGIQGQVMIFEARRGAAKEPLPSVPIIDVQVTVLGCKRHDFATAPGGEKGRRVGDVPVVPVARNDLIVTGVVAGFRIK